MLLRGGPLMGALYIFQGLPDAQPAKDGVTWLSQPSPSVLSLAAPPTVALIQRGRGTRKSAENLGWGSVPSGPSGQREATGRSMVLRGLG